MALSVQSGSAWHTADGPDVWVQSGSAWHGTKRIYVQSGSAWHLIHHNDKPTNLTLTDFSTCTPPEAWDIEVSWSCAADLGVQVYRDGVFIGSVGAGTYAYQDTDTLSINTTYEYSIRTTYSNTLSAAVSESITTGSPCGV